tara:strand:- start:289 stop:405 length:117 start_codon:yes stop_codon:yes gene_type:complete
MLQALQAVQVAEVVIYLHLLLVQELQGKVTQVELVLEM